ncbi:protein claret segregational-like isoform X1 [Vespa mandarinia]|uniref:protein claret segregational-like isoform X1 n=2 Tax=Vespa mandarinia TaxID=7446 RepID=UPI001622E36F|nr:protein claret segregational-like isoform X1 [Vespa mandarinia]
MYSYWSLHDKAQIQIRSVCLTVVLQMESRLPKPNHFYKKATTLIDIDLKKKNPNMTKTQTGLSRAVSSAKLTDDTKKDKNLLNNDGKSNNENESLPQTTRTKNIAAITRSNEAIKAMKRPGTIVTSANTKKPKVKVITPRKTLKTALNTRNGINRPTENNTNNKTTATTTVNKWDYKGRFAIVNGELIKLRGNYKEISSKNAELQKMIDDLRDNGNTYKLKLQECETLKAALSEELETTKDEFKQIQNEKEDFVKRWTKAEEAYKNVTKELKELQDQFADQQAKLQEQTIETERVKTKLEHDENLIKDLTIHKEELQSLVHQMDKERRILHNTIQEMKGNIRVFCRVRPRTPKESSKSLCFIKFVDECTIEIGKSDGSDMASCSGKVRNLRQEFSFDKVFPHNASQADIFEELSLLVQSALEGYNVCVFAYGQTGSGKTYTMEGEPGFDTEGMIPRTVRHIFKEMKELELLGWEYRIEASFLEIYNEHIVDLLDSQCNKIHEIRMRDNRGHDLYVSNLKVEEIHNAEELQECLLTAQRNRAVAATNSNERSSRSHSVARIRLIGEHKTKEEICIGNLNLVDLAGSERLKGEEAARTAETKNINKSLANLGNVILALLKKQEHVPYRNSKLTHLLMPSLGGNSKTLMLLNISPLDECYNETLNSLRFASNVNNCKINVKRVRTALPNISNTNLSSSSSSEI